MKETEYLRLRADAEVRYKRDLEAIERVWRLSGGKITSMAKVAPTGRSKGDLVKAIRVAIDKQTKNFSAYDLATVVKDANPEFEVKVGYVALVLRRLLEREKGEYIIQVKNVDATSPAMYKRALKDPLLAELNGVEEVEF